MFVGIPLIFKTLLHIAVIKYYSQRIVQLVSLYPSADRLVVYIILNWGLKHLLKSEIATKICSLRIDLRDTYVLCGKVLRFLEIKNSLLGR